MHQNFDLNILLTLSRSNSSHKLFSAECIFIACNICEQRVNTERTRRPRSGAQSGSRIYQHGGGTHGI